jgi:hypothetical protein
LIIFFAREESFARIFAQGETLDFTEIHFLLAGKFKFWPIYRRKKMSLVTVGLVCAAGFITGVNLKSDYETFVVGIEVECEGGFTIGHVNTGAGTLAEIGDVTFNSVVNRTLQPEHLSVDGGFDFLLAEQRSNRLFNLKLNGTNGFVNSTNGVSNWNPDLIELGCGDRGRVVGIYASMCAGPFWGICDLARIEDVVCEDDDLIWGPWSGWSSCVDGTPDCEERARVCLRGECVGDSIERRLVAPIVDGEAGLVLTLGTYPIRVATFLGEVVIWPNGTHEGLCGFETTEWPTRECGTCPEVPTCPTLPETTACPVCPTLPETTQLECPTTADTKSSSQNLNT